MRSIITVAIVALCVTPAFAKAKHKAHHAPVYTAEVEATPAPVDPQGYHPASQMEQTKAYCELVANGLQPSPGFVMGSPEFIAGASIGNAIGGAIIHARNYDHCMTLKGYAHN